ncbi:MAG TPA: VOC family protein [Armatimonadota bacterium]|jgi:lactoylglutathione lyase
MRYLHTMLRVKDLDKSLAFYQEVLGFRIQRRNDYEAKQFSLVFLTAPGDTEDGPTLELTYNWDRETPYARGDAYGHLAYEVDSLKDLGRKLKAAGLSFSWGPGKTPGGGRGMAFLEDPDGNEIELLEKAPTSATL